MKHIESFLKQRKNYCKVIILKGSDSPEKEVRLDYYISPDTKPEGTQDCPSELYLSFCSVKNGVPDYNDWYKAVIDLKTVSHNGTYILKVDDLRYPTIYAASFAYYCLGSRSLYKSVFLNGPQVALIFGRK